MLAINQGLKSVKMDSLAALTPQSPTKTRLQQFDYHTLGSVTEISTVTGCIWD
jgi:hypothetical protein